MIIRKQAFPRAALIGNPSDGYYGKTIAFVFDNYAAQVMLYETPELNLVPSLRDQPQFTNVRELVHDVGLYGYYGGIRLLKASIKRFVQYCDDHSIALHDRNFTMRYRTTIPNRLGLAGSSAIITAAIRGLCQFYNVELNQPEMANLVLSVVRDELGIPAGLQDRVAQAYNHPVFMDFDKEYMAEHNCGKYELIDLPQEMNLYIAYRTDLSEGSEILHSRLREDYEAGVPAVLDAMQEWAYLTDQVRKVIEEKDFEKLPALLNRNFDLRCQVCGKSVSPQNRKMVELARSVGASAKFTGSGGAIIGTYKDAEMLKNLTAVLKEHKINVLLPRIVTDPAMAYV